MGFVYIIISFIVVVAFFLYDRTQSRYTKQLKTEIYELRKKVEKQQKIINTLYGNEIHKEKL
ncbi:hypothetical protein [Bacillus sp. 1NLA3E]|uniref:hypothetical protein n=1 Tax=Bacillus sp. 1NLA3E TaxID=666686 RepID=UPI000247E6FE|nr:hypothetical protein [Bacillus sp. 1NLA3E]AGK54892.1 hypothetical protein B1NLA3E_15730 [Bacillus sp. 1NLA3E]